MLKAIRIDADKRVGELELVDINGSHLAAMQQVVEGYIERIPLKDGSSMYINEEGKLSGLPFNSIATDVALLNQAIMPWDNIVGNAFIVGPDLHNTGDDSDVTEWQRERVRLVAREAGGVWV